MWRVCGSRRWLRCFRIGCWCWKGRVPPVDGRQARGEDPARRGRTRPSNFPESRLSSKIYLSCPMASDEELEAALQGLTISGRPRLLGKAFLPIILAPLQALRRWRPGSSERAPIPDTGFIFLKEHGRLDLSVEALRSEEHTSELQSPCN